MSIKTRYNFLKKIYPDTLVIFKKKNNYFCLYDDYIIFCKCNNNINIVKEKFIDYLIIENLSLEEKSFFENHNYCKYYKICILENFFEIIFKNYKIK